METELEKEIEPVVFEAKGVDPKFSHIPLFPSDNTELKKEGKRIEELVPIAAEIQSIPFDNIQTDFLPNPTGWPFHPFTAGMQVNAVISITNNTNNELSGFLRNFYVCISALDRIQLEFDIAVSDPINTSASVLEGYMKAKEYILQNIIDRCKSFETLFPDKLLKIRNELKELKSHRHEVNDFTAFSGGRREKQNIAFIKGNRISIHIGRTELWKICCKYIALAFTMEGRFLFVFRPSIPKTENRSGSTPSNFEQCYDIDEDLAELESIFVVLYGENLGWPNNRLISCLYLKETQREKKRKDHKSS